MPGLAMQTVGPTVKLHPIMSGGWLHALLSVYSDATDVPELGPNHHMVHCIAEAEHKAQRSLMHRCAYCWLAFVRC
jgi:hypothetical protein